MAKGLVVKWWYWLPFWRWRILGEVDAVDEVPDHLPAKSMVVVPMADGIKWIVFDCPCGMGHRIMLNADRNRKPFWALDAKNINIFPSVDFRDEKKRCHYFIHGGRTIWMKDSYR